MNEFGPDDFDPDWPDLDPEVICQLVEEQGSIRLDDQGQLLVKCPEAESTMVCGLYPVPGPEKDDSVETWCSGPIIGCEDVEKTDSGGPFPDCPYYPDR